MATVGTPAQRWFDRRTFHSAAVDLETLIARKRAAGLAVSVVLPAYNEAETIGGVVAAAAELGGALVDEIVVIDGGSTDETATRAVAAGARVHHDSQLLPDYGPGLGKGDALWRSLTVTSGDLVAFCDADIRNPDPRFFERLLAPLIDDESVQLVKGFYERPVEIDEVLHATGGGRVTELLARPLLNLFWPPLAGIVQPLSGEYAGRRSLLEALPFFTGYGVDFGLLIDTLSHVGVDVIAQTDMVERVHRNQPLEALSRMAFAILQVAMRRLRDDGRGAGIGALPDEYVQFLRREETLVAETHTVTVVERPPIRSLR